MMKSVTRSTIPRTALAVPALALSCLSNAAPLDRWDARNDSAKVGTKVVKNLLNRGHYRDHKDDKFPEKGRKALAAINDPKTKSGKFVPLK